MVLKQIYCEAAHLLNPVLGLIEKAVELYGNVEVEIDLVIHDAAIKTNIGRWEHAQFLRLVGLCYTLLW